MTDRPVRIKRERTKGWKMPPNTVCVTRPGPYGNPFVDGEVAPAVYSRFHRGVVEGTEHAIELFRRVLAYELSRPTDAASKAVDLVADLRGKNLACWCALDQPCHADVLLELANRPICEEVR